MLTNKRQKIQTDVQKRDFKGTVNPKELKTLSYLTHPDVFSTLIHFY